MTTMKLRPGYLVALKSTVTGGVHYSRTDLDSTGVEAAARGTDAAIARWETVRIVDDPSEYEAATKIRAKAVSLVRSACAVTSFGLLCPTDGADALDAAVAEAQRLVREHNERASCTRASLYVLKGQIAETDDDAARAVSAELTELIAAMAAGIDALDPLAIRAAATKAQGMLQMFSTEAQRAADDAVKEARRAARAIVRRVVKRGETAADVLAGIQRDAITRARFAFTWADGTTEAAEPPPEPEGTMPTINLQRFADLGDEAA